MDQPQKTQTIRNPASFKISLKRKRGLSKPRTPFIPYIMVKKQFQKEVLYTNLNEPPQIYLGRVYRNYLEVFMAEKFPSWIERLLLPKLSDITGEIKAVNSRIDCIEKSVENLRNEMLTRFEAVHKEIGSLRNEMGSLRNEMGSLRNEMGSLRNEMLTRFEAVHKEVGGLKNEMMVRFEAVHKEIGSLRNEVMIKFEAVNKEIESLRNETSIRFGSLEKVIPVMEKLAELETRISQIEKRRE